MGFHDNLQGADLHSPSYENVTNNSGSTISILTAVRFTQVVDGFPEINTANPAAQAVRGVTTT